MGPVIALALKDLIHLIRDRGAAFFTLVFPLLVAMFFGFIFGGAGAGGSKLPVVVINEDGGAESVAFVEDIQADTALEVAVAKTRDEGETLVRKGRVVAAIVIPKEFGEQAGSIFSGGSIRVEGIVDPSKRAEVGLLTGKLNELAFGQMSNQFADTDKLNQSLEKARGTIQSNDKMPLANKLLFGAMFDSIKGLAGSQAPQATQTPGAEATSAQNPMAGWKPVVVDLKEIPSRRIAPRSGYEISFAQGVVWGLMGCVTAFGASLASERMRGTLMRLTIAPITRSQVLIGKAMACFLACMIVQAMLIVFGVIVFKVKIDSPGLLLLVSVACGFGFTGLMMLIAGMTRTEGGGSGMARAVVLVLAMIGGGTVPMFVMPPFMQTVSKISPFSWATTCYEGATWRQFDLATIMVPVLVLVGFGIAGFVIGILNLKWADRLGG